MTFKKLKAIKSKHIGCLNCGNTENVLNMKTRLYNGFGGWKITKKGELYFVEQINTSYNSSKRLSEIEKEAAKEPDCDWRAIVNLPLRGATYQRQGVKKWVLVKENQGFV